MLLYAQKIKLLIKFFKDNIDNENISCFNYFNSFNNVNSRSTF